MTVFGYPDLIQYNLNARAIADLRGRMTQTSAELITGEYEDKTKATDGNVGEAHLLLKSVNDTQRRLDSFALVQSRIDVSISALEGVRTSVQPLVAKIFDFVPTAERTALRALQVEAESTVRQTFDALNTSHGGRYLFSGDATDQAALQDPDQFIADIRAIAGSAMTVEAYEDALETYFNDPAGGFATDVYSGGAGEMSGVALGSGSRVGYTLKADAQGVRDVLRGLATIVVSDSLNFTPGTEAFNAVTTQAAGQINSGNYALIDMSTQIGVSSQLLENATDKDRSEQNAFKQAYTQMIGRDQYEAATALKLLETQLEAAYTLTSRISQLKLVNFLR